MRSGMCTQRSLSFVQQKRVMNLISLPGQQHDGALWTHLTAENTTIIPPSLSNPHSSSRGGHGVGTGFDADDAGEEDDEDLVFEEVDDESETSNSALDQTSSTAKNGAKTASSALLPPDDTVDWRIDSLLRALVSSADFWIEVRGLRSGKARDCHGEVSSLPSNANYIYKGV